MKKYKCNNYEICPEIREYLGHVKDIHEKYFHPETYRYIKNLTFKESIHDLKKEL